MAKKRVSSQRDQQTKHPLPFSYLADDPEAIEVVCPECSRRSTLMMEASPAVTAEGSEQAGPGFVLPRVEVWGCPTCGFEINKPILAEIESTVASASLVPLPPHEEYEDSGIAPLLVRKAHRDADNVIVRDVYVEDCYQVAVLPSPNKRILDVGAHIGVATCKMMDRWPDAIYCVIEPEASNRRALEEQLRRRGESLGTEPKVTILGGAIDTELKVKDAGGVPSTDLKVTHAGVALSYSDRPIYLHSTVYPETANTGGSFVGGVDAHAGLQNEDDYIGHHPVRAITVEEIMAEMRWDTIDLVKIDAEGAEMDLLRHGPIEKIGVIVGEWHNLDGINDILMKRCGVRIGGNQDGERWRLDVLRNNVQMGLFRLSQPNWWNRLLH